MKRVSFILVMAVCITLVGFLGLLARAQAAGEPLKITLNAENNSGETGTATLTDLGNGKTMVDVEITGAPDGVSQPMHIHTGQCGPTLGKVVFPLTNLENGKSSTTIDTALDALMTGDFAINGHKSAAEAAVYVFCGNIPASEAMMMAHETEAAMMMTEGTATTEAMMMAEGTATHEAMMMAEATATHEAMMMAEATATHEAMMMAEATATHEAMMMAEATATHEAMMMAEATATHEAMMMAEATATTEAMMMAEATATTEAVMAQATTTPAAEAAAATPAPTAIAVVPNTGSSNSSDGLWLLIVVGLVALGTGIAVRQTVRRN